MVFLFTVLFSDIQSKCIKKYIEVYSQIHQGVFTNTSRCICAHENMLNKGKKAGMNRDLRCGRGLAKILKLHCCIALKNGVK